MTKEKERKQIIICDSAFQNITLKQKMTRSFLLLMLYFINIIIINKRITKY